MTPDRKLSSAQLTAAQIKEFMAGVVPWPTDDAPGYVTIHWQHPGKKGFFGHSCRTIDDVLQQITRLQAGVPANIYFCTSSQKLNNGHRDRENAIALQCVPVDIDVDPNDPKKYATLPDAIAALLRCCVHLGIPRPSFMVASGGGIHAYWLSDRTLPVDEWQIFADALKAAFKNAGLKFDAACTGDAARVLRVPGTTNWKLPGQPRPVRLLQSSFCSRAAYDFAAVFGKILGEKAAPATRFTIAKAFKHLDPKVSLGEGIVFDELPPLPLEPILAECAWLREAHDTGGKAFNEPQWYLTMLAATFIENGRELAHQLGNQHEGYTFESTEEKWAHANRAHETKNIGWPQCKTIEVAGSEHCKSCPHFPEGKSPINLALQEITPSVIAKWNKRHAHVLAGGKSAVLQEFQTPEGYTDFKLLSSASFHEWNIEHEIYLGVDKKGKPVKVPVTIFWMRHAKRRKYQDIGFFPGPDMPDYYNLWRGFAVEPRKGDCSKFLAHVRENICQGDDALYAWVMAWFADIFQRPAVKSGTSLALRGEQGVGKTKIGEVMGGLLGVHYKLVADPRYVTGRFNSHMISLLMLHADEGFWAGDKKAEGKLKDLVTGKSHPIEFKNKEAFWINNYVRLLVSGNQDWQVPAGFEERRFGILDVGNAHKQDHAYFAAIDAEMDAGGREALLHHLLFEVDCSKVNLRQIPHTAALLEQKLETASPEHGWWLDILRRGVLPLPAYRDDKAPQNETPSETLYDDYIEHAKKQGVPRRAIETQLGIFLQKVVGPGLRRSKKKYHTRDRYGTLSVEKRGLVYVFPPLNKCRQSFAGLLNEEITWEGADGGGAWG